MNKKYGIYYMFFCFLLLCLFITGLYFTGNTENGTYILKSYEGKIALFTNDSSEPLKVYEVYIRNLPEQDIKELQNGIKAENEEELSRLLEDFEVQCKY